MINMKGKFALAGCFCVLTVILIALLLFVDVAPIGPVDTKVGLSHLNGAFHDLTGVNWTWYKITNILGMSEIAVAAAFALAGFWQLIRRRSLAKVDREIFALGGLYAVVVALYILFDKVAVNYRPVLMEGETFPESSFPSSHTMLVCTVLGSAIMVMGRFVKNDDLRKILRVVCGIVIVVTVVGRLISGVHWLTDIVGGVLISAALLAVFSGALDMMRER